MSCGTCGIQASNTMQGDTGVPGGAPQTRRPRCPHCQAFIPQDGAPCTNPRCQRNAPAPPQPLDSAVAYQQALAAGPSDATRAAAGQDPKYAFSYARNVDRAPRDDTRRAAGQNPQWAYRYAADVDKAPRDDTRAAACQDPEWAYQYAADVDRGPRDDTRQAASRIPGYAYAYAYAVDRGPHPTTRAAACQDPYTAFSYARNVEKQPHDDTRAAVAGSPAFASLYADWEKFLAGGPPERPASSGPESKNMAAGAPGSSRSAATSEPPRPLRRPRERVPKRFAYLSYHGSQEAASTALDKAGFTPAERDTLLNIHDRLPHGSGLDGNYTLEVAATPGRARTVQAYITYSAMDEDGYYCHDYDVGVTLHLANWQPGGKVTVGRVTTGRTHSCCGFDLADDLTQRFELAFAEDVANG